MKLLAFVPSVRSPRKSLDQLGLESTPPSIAPLARNRSSTS